MRLMRFREVRERVGLSRSTIWRLERQGLFVKRRKLSGKTVGWPEDEVDAWLKGRPQF
jgi:prophage regulatory protein